jgi:hypothetical protein
MIGLIKRTEVKNNMAVGYCVKCKKKGVEIVDAKKTTTSKGKPMMKGKCPHCGTTVCTFKVD